MDEDFPDFSKKPWWYAVMFLALVLLGMWIAHSCGDNPIVKFFAE
jgi:hypothetical protein